MKKKHSSFSEKVYAVVAKIPKGQVMTYAGVARKIGSRAPRVQWVLRSQKTMT
jgi:alkylated DNA nucleotide flippase Atl1